MTDREKTEAVIRKVASTVPDYNPDMVLTLIAVNRECKEVAILHQKDGAIMVDFLTPDNAMAFASDVFNAAVKASGRDVHDA